MAEPLNLQVSRSDTSVWDRRDLRSRLDGIDVERWLLGIGGGVLLVQGLRHASIPGALMAALGGTMVYRASTGHHDLSRACDWVTQALPQHWWKPDVVEEASEDSFPASDSPGWGPTAGATTD